MKKEYKALLLVLLVVLIILGSFIFYNQWPLMTGEKIILATQPVDPFDPLRGQYMTINYEISRVENTAGINIGDTVYISLQEDDEGIWRLENVLQNKPLSGDFIKGTVERESGDDLIVKYGIEQYFFERNADVPTRNITVEVAVASSGRAKIVQLLQNGEPIEIEYEEFDIKS